MTKITFLAKAKFIKCFITDKRLISKSKIASYYLKPVVHRGSEKHKAVHIFMIIYASCR